MGSTRLPGKVMKLLDGHSVLAWCVRACWNATGVVDVWVATSTLPADDVIADAYHGKVWRGSETDVLSRFVGCAKASGADVILRITGDEPFVDPQVIGAVTRLMKTSGAAYVTNVSPRTYPDGLDVQAFTKEALLAADAEATRPIDRDCVTTWIERNRDRFPSETLINPIPGMAGERWVLDTEKDLAFCEAVADAWGSWNDPPSMLDILDILDRYPEIRAINAGGIANERFYDALAEEPIHERTFQRSQQAFEAAKAIIPLGAQTFSKSWLQYPQPSPLFASHGDGAELFDIDGNAYVDLVSALLPTILGYRDPDVDAAIRRQLASGISLSLATRLEQELAAELVRLIPCAEAVRFGKTGTDVTTAAIRLARAHTGRDRVLICGGYHGWQDWSVERNLGVPYGVRELTTRITFGDIMEATRTLCGLPKQTYAAVIVEPEGDPEYLQGLRNLCDKTGAVLIFDEVITGFRFDIGGAQKFWGVTPDLATFGKAMANGMPLSAIVGRKDIMRRMEPPDNIFYSGTMFGETLSLAAGLATIRKLEREHTLAKVWETGASLGRSASDMIFDYGMAEYIQLHGQPPMVRLTFKDGDIAALFRREMIASGTLIIASHNISAAHGANEIKRVVASYRHTLAILREALDKGDVKERLAGATVGPMVRS
jgi:glutamate-1-semialdehyde 2,1-aminomutase